MDTYIPLCLFPNFCDFLGSLRLWWTFARATATSLSRPYVLSFLKNSICPLTIEFTNHTEYCSQVFLDLRLTKFPPNDRPSVRRQPITYCLAVGSKHTAGGQAKFQNKGASIARYARGFQNACLSIHIYGAISIATVPILDSAYCLPARRPPSCCVLCPLTWYICY